MAVTITIGVAAVAAIWNCGGSSENRLYTWVERVCIYAGFPTIAGAPKTTKLSRITKIKPDKIAGVTIGSVIVRITLKVLEPKIFADCS